MLSDPAVVTLMYFVLPLWLIAGFADWLCHRASHIESTTGAKKSSIYLIMFAEVGVPLLAGMFLEINAGIILLLIIAFFMHEATAMWDVSYATTARNVTPVEQHIHSFLEMIPLMAILLMVGLHWSQFEALVGFGPEHARFDFTWKLEGLPIGYISTIFVMIFLFEFLPYIEEFIRGLRSSRGRLVPEKAEEAGTKGSRTYER